MKNKHNKYLYISIFCTLIILIMWLIASASTFQDCNNDWDNVYTEIITLGGKCYLEIESYYGLGKTYYYDYDNQIILDEDIDLDVWESSTNHFHYSGYRTKYWYSLWTGNLPGFRFGWILIILCILQYLFLIRIREKTTKPFARPVKVNEVRRIRSRYLNKKLKLKRTRFLIPTKCHYIVIIITILFSLSLLVSDYILAFEYDLPKYHVFGRYVDVEVNFLYIEFILPTIVYLLAIFINSYCILKYIKLLRKSFLSETDLDIQF